jgi:hypothetical protein
VTDAALSDTQPSLLPKQTHVPVLQVHVSLTWQISPGKLAEYPKMHAARPYRNTQSLWLELEKRLGILRRQEDCHPHILSPERNSTSLLAGAYILVLANSSRNGTTVLERTLLALHSARTGAIYRGRGHDRARGRGWARLLAALTPSTSRLVSTESASAVVRFDNVRLDHGGQVRKRSEDPNKEVSEAHHV